MGFIGDIHVEEDICKMDIKKQLWLGQRSNHSLFVGYGVVRES